MASYRNAKQKKHFELEPRPQRLKDFLIDDSASFSPSGFTSFPRRPHDHSTKPQNRIAQGSSTRATTLPRSRSSRAALTALQTMIAAVKSFHFTTVKTPSFLPRSLSRRLSRRNSRRKNDCEEDRVKGIIRVKDILRWRSSRDLIQERSTPLEFTPTPLQPAAESSSSTSDRSSWCESDFTFTAEDLPRWSGDSEATESSKEYLPSVGGHSLDVGPREEFSCKKQELHSPVSVLNFKSEGDEEALSPFDRCLTNMERTKKKLMQRINEFESLAKVDHFGSDEWMSREGSEEISSSYGDEDGKEEEEEEREETDLGEEYARQVLNSIKAKFPSGLKGSIDKLLFNFLRDEYVTGRAHADHRFQNSGTIMKETMHRAEAWINGEENESFDSVKDDVFGGRWNQLEEENGELAFDIEMRVFHVLVDELLGDLFSC